MRSVRQVVRFCSKLQAESFFDGKDAEQAEVRVNDGRSSQCISSRGAEAYCRYRCIGIGIVVWVTRSNASQQSDRRQNLIGSLRVVRSIQRSSGGCYRKRKTGVGAKCPVNLPAAEDMAGNSILEIGFALSKWQLINTPDLEVVRNIEA